MTKDDVLAIYEAELARCVAGPAEAASVRARLIAELDREIAAAKAGGAGERVAALQKKRSGMILVEVDSRSPESHALQGTRCRVHEALQAETPPPHATDDWRTITEDLDDVHDAQKRHFKNLWKEADRLVRDAGIGENGVR